jgi:hypothetical protein
MKAGSKKDPTRSPEEAPAVDPLFKDLAPPETDPKDESIIILRKEGKSYRQIQKELGVGQGRIAEVLAGAGLIGEQRRREEVKSTMLLFDDEFIGSIIELPFDYLAKRQGEHWKLSPEEKKKLAVLSNKISSKYLPLWLERYADEVSLILTVGTIVYPRYLMTQELLQRAREPQPKVESVE